MPVETQIVHYPEREKYVAGQGKYIKAGTSGSQVYATNTTTTYQTAIPTTTNYTTAVPATTSYTTSVPQTYVSGGYTGGYTTGGYTTGGYTTGGYTTGGYTTGGYTTSGQTTYISNSRVNTTIPVNTQSFVSGAHGTGSNYGYTTGGGLETSAYTSAGYAQPLSGVGYVTKDGTHLSSTGHIVSGNTSGSQVKNNQSYATNI